MLQTVYLKVLDGRARFDARSSAKTWLFAVIRRTAAERRRRQGLLDLVPIRLLQLQPEPASTPDPETLADISQSGERLRAALLRLSGQQREVLHLVFYHDLTIEDAAAILGIAIGSARTHYHRGKARLRELLVERET